MAAIREIIKLGDPLLRQRAAQVRRFGFRLEKLLDDMACTMYASNGCGLAAPQIGISKCIVVIDDGQGLIELINPTIRRAEGEISDVEYCLSVPELGGEVKRAESIRVEAQDRKGKICVYEAEGFLARIFQHEIDHLQGRLFVDIMTREVRDEKPEKLQNEAQEQVQDEAQNNE
ncbi:MAG: peptide deformylase [Firmicutes bacterium]|nr:peptide deformylase [Bacillota bacterium]